MLRQGDLYALPVERHAYDVAIIHQVLHYLDEPARAIREAARALRPRGRLLVVDFAPHADESLRERHAHRRLGFGADEIGGYMRDAGLDVMLQRDLVPDAGEGTLTVSLWLAQDRTHENVAEDAARDARRPRERLSPTRKSPDGRSHSFPRRGRPASLTSTSPSNSFRQKPRRWRRRSGRRSAGSRR